MIEHFDSYLAARAEIAAATAELLALEAQLKEAAQGLEAALAALTRYDDGTYGGGYLEKLRDDALAAFQHRAYLQALDCRARARLEAAREAAKAAAVGAVEHYHGVIDRNAARSARTAQT